MLWWHMIPRPVDRKRTVTGKRRKALEALIREAVRLHDRGLSEAQKAVVFDRLVEAAREARG